MPLGTTDPAFAGLLDVFDRPGGYQVAVTGNQHLVEDNLIQYFKAVLPEFIRELPGAGMKTVNQIIDTGPAQILECCPELENARAA